MLEQNKKNFFLNKFYLPFLLNFVDKKYERIQSVWLENKKFSCNIKIDLKALTWIRWRKKKNKTLGRDRSLILL